MGLVNLISFKKFIHVTEPDLDSMLEDILSGELDTLDGFCNQKLFVCLWTANIKYSDYPLQILAHP